MPKPFQLEKDLGGGQLFYSAATLGGNPASHTNHVQARVSTQEQVPAMPFLGEPLLQRRHLEPQTSF